ncbi:hypothetical protein EHS13_19070 [Paenibacillus psychroresistens]|uniref:Uncharacterized protein n=1 Tax=Paenibacillus psychroresistens TaxID=1778678 RepID=A0A6B8RK91_9BACL|nr:hypothetical protein [Paenibacillus psychroresistens]QGQ96831.1 hypothetical protein EHS13_19070 [Paenibacillus psychroresistens]
MKLRFIPILITVAASSALLFGGWYFYQNNVVENPIKDVILGVQGVNQVSTNINNSQVSIDLKLNKDADLRNLYSTISKEGASLLRNRELKLNLESQTSPELEQWWSTALFDVAQAMDTKHYADIPQVLKAQDQEIPGLKVMTEMDETNVYVRLTDGEHSKYVILPRTPAQMGVWPNE